MKDGCLPILGRRRGGRGARTIPLGTRVGAARRAGLPAAGSAAACSCWLWMLCLTAAVNRLVESMCVQHGVKLDRAATGVPGCRREPADSSAGERNAAAGCNGGSKACVRNETLV